MSMSTFQKVTLVCCVVLCVALLLPKMLLSGNKRDSSSPAGLFPPMLQRKPVPGTSRGTGGNRPHNPEAIARAKGSTAGGGKSNLAGQIIPVYGFGILLYILYIIFKITSSGKTTKPHESRFPTVRSENLRRKITDFELTQLQERLMETEEVMERIVTRARAQSTSSLHSVGGEEEDQEEKLLLRLREITRVMQEGRLVEGIPSERTQGFYHHRCADDPDETLRSCVHHCCNLHNGDAEGDTDERGGERWIHEQPHCYQRNQNQNLPADETVHDHLSAEEPSEEPAEMMPELSCYQTEADDGSFSGDGIRRRTRRDPEGGTGQSD
ncbi:protein RIC-3b [Trichomycterus rosablanca]|uniref:protein RIC-3b n=1 Tax=Trichomycterus rosablanca TaxID=2290929 RepID=UPI002F3570EB